MQPRADNRAPSAAASMMRRAIDVAAGSHPHPNPRVGAVVLDAAGNLVSEAYHEGPGRSHAEAAAIREAGETARGGTLVVTLEPCDHEGRTPPCTSAIVAAGVAKVLVGAVDPDPRVAGRGIARLREAGVDVEVGIETEAAEALDPGYFHHRRTGLPRVTLKLAATLDGQTAAADGTSQWITSEAARRDAHLLRARSDAVLVGAGTLRDDDPGLDARLEAYEGPQPRPVVLAGRRPLPPQATCYVRNPLVYAAGDVVSAPDTLEVVQVGGEGGRVDLGTVIKDLGARGIVDLLVEGGATVAGSLWRAGLVDRLVIYLAGAVAGGVGAPMFNGIFETLDERRPVRIEAIRMVGPDLRIEATTQEVI